MKLELREIDPNTVSPVTKGGSSFEVTSKLVLQAENGQISYTIVYVPPYTKQYELEKVDLAPYIDNPDRTIFFAYVDDELAGQISVFKNWNDYAYIDHLAVNENYRGQGIGRALMERAIEWAKARGFSGITLETQDNNVPACRFYASCGFELRGFDTYLYKAQDPASNEIALFWYLMF